MTDMPPLFVEIKPSKLKLYFLITVHLLAILSLVLINDLAVVSTLLKTFLVLFVIVSFKRCLSYHYHNVQLHLKPDGLVDFNIGNKEYLDLQFSRESYISDVFLQLIFLDGNAEVSHAVTVFPDSIDAAMQSQLRARLKLVSNGESSAPV